MTERNPLPECLSHLAQLNTQRPIETAAIRRAALEEARDVEPVGGDYIDAGGWYVGYAHGVRAKTDAIAALIEGDAAINAKPPAP
jgi:hypothetical protein